jgi:hypothetical protein
VAQRTYRVPSCDSTSSTCLPTGRQVTENCPVPSGTFCRVNGRIASLVRFMPACQDGSTCASGGQIDTSSARACTSVTPTCANAQTETRNVNQCASDTQCATQDVVCGRQPTTCSADRSSLLRYTGACESGTGCVTTVAQTCPAPTCGQVAGAQVWQRCTSSCGVNSDGVTGCNSSCTTCAAQQCERNAAGVLTGRVCGGCGTDANGVPICRTASDCTTCANGCNANTNACNLIIVSPLGGVGTLGGVISGATVAPGAGVVSQ